MTFRASVHIYMFGPVLRVVILSRNGDSTDFRSISRSHNSHRSPSLYEVWGCSRSPLAGLIWLETYDQVNHAISLNLMIRLRHYALQIVRHQWIHVVVLASAPDFHISTVDHP